MPFNEFYEIIQSNELNTKAEIEVVNLIDGYITHKNKFPILPEEDPANDWSHLTEEEKKKREEDKKTQVEAKAKAVADEEAKKQEEYAKLDAEGKMNHDIAKA